MWWGHCCVCDLSQLLFKSIHTAGSDYESTTFSLIFMSSDEGQNVLCADVPILNDRLGNEPVEAFSVSIIDISPAGTPGSSRESCVFIIDDDGKYDNFILLDE